MRDTDLQVSTLRSDIERGCAIGGAAHVDKKSIANKNIANFVMTPFYRQSKRRFADVALGVEELSFVGCRQEEAFQGCLDEHVMPL